MEKTSVSSPYFSYLKSFAFKSLPLDIFPLIDNDYFPALLSEIQEAKIEIFGVVYCWRVHPKRKNDKPSRLLQAIVDANNRGVGCFILFNFDSGKSRLHRGNKEVFLLLKYSGVSVRWAPGNRLTHAKTFIIDNKVSFVGSHNLTTRSLSSSKEVSLKAYDTKLSSFLGVHFWDIWKNSKE